MTASLGNQGASTGVTSTMSYKEIHYSDSTENFIDCEWSPKAQRAGETFSRATIWVCDVRTLCGSWRMAGEPERIRLLPVCRPNSRYQPQVYTSRKILASKGGFGRFSQNWRRPRYEQRETMSNSVIRVIGYLMLCSSVLSQEQARDLKGDGHLLGETAAQFFSEGHVGDLDLACQEKNWKSVKQLFKNPDYASKTNAKDICAKEKLAKQQAISGTRLEYDGPGDDKAMRADTFTFDGGHLVKIDMVYAAPMAKVEGFHPKSFGELFAGLQEAYGPPSKSYSEPWLDPIGLKYDAHHAVWMRPQDVISINEEPGADGRTGIVAETLSEHNRAAHAPKSQNPLE